MKNYLNSTWRCVEDVWNSMCEFFTDIWNFFDVPARTFVILIILFCVAFFVADWNADKTEDPKKAIRWGGLRVLFVWLWFSFVFVLIFYGFYAMNPDSLPALSILILIILVFCIATIFQVRGYWDGVNNDKKRKKTAREIDKTIKGWVTNGQSLKWYRISLFDDFGRYIVPSEESTSLEDHKPLLDGVDIEGIIESVPKVFSMQITGDDGEIFIIHFSHIDEGKIGEISEAIGVNVKKIRILTQERNNVYNVFHYWLDSLTRFVKLIKRAFSGPLYLIFEIFLNWIWIFMQPLIRILCFNFHFQKYQNVYH